MSSLQPATGQGLRGLATAVGGRVEQAEQPVEVLHVCNHCDVVEVEARAECPICSGSLIEVRADRDLYCCPGCEFHHSPETTSRRRRTCARCRRRLVRVHRAGRGFRADGPPDEYRGGGASTISMIAGCVVAGVASLNVAGAIFLALTRPEWAAILPLGAPAVVVVLAVLWGSVAGIVSLRRDRLTRTNHALEHATAHILKGRGHQVFEGRSHRGGFWLAGTFRKADVAPAFEMAERLLREHDPSLAVHAHCGGRILIFVWLTVGTVFLGPVAGALVLARPAFWPLLLAFPAVWLALGLLSSALQRWITTRTDFRWARARRVTRQAGVVFVETEIDFCRRTTRVRPLRRLPRELRTPRVEEAAAWLREQDFEEIGGYAETFDGAENPVRAFYSASRGAYADVYALSTGQPMVLFVTPFDDGVLLVTLTAPELAGIYGPVITRARPNRRARLRSHLAEGKLLAARGRAPSAAGTLEERMRLAQKWTRHYDAARATAGPAPRDATRLRQREAAGLIQHWFAPTLAPPAP